MQEQVQDKIPLEQKNLNKRHVNIMIIVLVVLAILLLVVGGGFIIFLLSNVDDEVNNSQITPTTAIATPTAGLKVTNTPAPEVAQGQKYVLTDCEVELEAEDIWQPSPRGSLGTCGLFYTGSSENLSNFAEYDGTVIAFMPFDTDSPYVLEQEEVANYTAYLDELETDEDNFKPDKDFLYERKDGLLNGQYVEEAKIYRVGVGDTNQIFYKISGRDYVIVYGGKDFDQQAIDKLLESIEYLTPLPTVIY